MARKTYRGESKADAGETLEDVSAQKEYRRWWRELELGLKREKDWRETAGKLWKIYRGVDAKKHSFNILWSNTETLRQSVYASVPRPDVRRRFRDSDPLGKAVSEVFERALFVAVDHYDFDASLKYDVLDSLVDGRGLSRIRYIPSFQSVSGSTDETTPSTGEQYEEKEYEQVCCEHVDYDDFAHGYGRVWGEVEWVGFRHKLKKEDVKERFGDEIASAIKYDSVIDEKDEKNTSKASPDAESEIDSVCEMWEMWDKEGKRVFFLTEHWKKLIFPVDNPAGDPPIEFEGFFPVPEPLRMVEDSGSLIPTPLYELYRAQAEELERISGRIIRIVGALKVRGVYDSTLAELSNLMTAEDNQMIPASQASKWMTNGGIEKAIWWMPIQQAAQVLRELYVSRDSAKQTIYELTGISDIVRGATNANETATAQKLKANYASVRLKKMQQAVQKYSRDLLRMMAEVIGEKFSPQTLQVMTGLQFPDAAAKAQAQLLMQQNPQQPNPQAQAVLQMPSWEDIKGVMSSDWQRTFRVDIETDSTVQGILEEDMAAMREVLTALVQFWQGVGPAVQSGALPMDAVKSISLSIARRAKMGMEVEDALEKMQQPQPQAQDNSKLMEKQAEGQIREKEIAAEQQSEQARIQSEQARDQARMQHEKELAAFKAHVDETLQAKQAENDNNVKLAIAQMQESTKLAIAEMNKEAKTQINMPDIGESVKSGIGNANTELVGTLQEFAKAFERMSHSMMAEKEVVYDPKTGRPTGTRIKLNS